jgi:hypothetical protein
MKNRLFVAGALIFLSILTLQLASQAKGTAFTYPGSPTDNGSPASGGYDLQFALYMFDTGRSPVGDPLTNTAVAVSKGLFTVTLDFGDQFLGANRWLEIGLRTNGGGGFTTLTPRQLLTPAPTPSRRVRWSAVGCPLAHAATRLLSAMRTIISLAPSVATARVWPT